MGGMHAKERMDIYDVLLVVEEEVEEVEVIIVGGAVIL